MFLSEILKLLINFRVFLEFFLHMYDDVCQYFETSGQNGPGQMTIPIKYA